MGASPAKRLCVCSSSCSSWSSSLPPSSEESSYYFVQVWLKGAWSCMAFRFKDARRDRSHVFHLCLFTSSCRPPAGWLRCPATVLERLTLARTPPQEVRTVASKVRLFWVRPTYTL